MRSGVLSVVALLRRPHRAANRLDWITLDVKCLGVESPGEPRTRGRVRSRKHTDHPGFREPFSVEAVSPEVLEMPQALYYDTVRVGAADRVIVRRSDSGVEPDHHHTRR